MDTKSEKLKIIDRWMCETLPNRLRRLYSIILKVGNIFADLLNRAADTAS